MQPTNGSVAAKSIPIVTITPEEAALILETNQNNRHIRPTRVERYARDMASGNWLITGDPIVIDKNGNLIQGQHRLLACITAGVSFDVPLMEGADPAAWNVMDTGAARTLGDVLRREGWTSPAAEAAAINAILRWSAGAIHTAWTLSHQEGIAFAQANPEVRDACRLAARFRGSDVKGWGMPYLAALSFFTSKHDQENHDEFFETARSGIGLYDGHPVLALRRLTARSSEAKGSLDRSYILAVYIKAWNAFVTHRQMNILTWKRGGTNGESFPVLMDANGKPIPLTYRMVRVESRT